MITHADIAFYWNEFGDDLGLWPSGNQPPTPTDMWDDVLPSLDSLEEWLAASAPPANINNAMQAVPFDIWQLKQFSRVGLWGVGL
jgi:hypothetical protein